MKTFFYVACMMFLASCSSAEYEEKVVVNEKSEVFYKPQATRSDAEKLGQYLQKKGYFDTLVYNAVYLSKDDSSYTLRFTGNKDTVLKYYDLFGKMFWFWQQDLSANVFGNQPMRLILSTERQKDFDTIPAMQRVSAKDKNYVYAHEKVTLSDAQRLSEYIASDRSLSAITRVFLTMESGTHVIHIPWDEFNRMNTPGSSARLSQLKYDISRRVFANRPVTIIIMNNDFEVIDNIPDPTPEQVQEFNAGNSR
ncbi:MAG TPA: hypothetical protein VFZ78_08430 [Flavisolibacter sp.]